MTGVAAMKTPEPLHEYRSGTPLPSDGDHSGRSLGAEEIELLREVIEAGKLNCTGGAMVAALEREFAERYGARHCTAVSSGTAALHSAVAAIDPGPGDEIITSPITDIGGIAPILYQTALPVFADVDPETCNVTAATIAPRITSRTRAIIVTHLFGNPCDMDPIMDLARHHGLPVIEDCAQSHLATYRGRLTGTLGSIGCFSLQQTKLMTAGEGGIVIVDDDLLASRVRLFHDKGWSYGDPQPEWRFLGLNYRMTELQGAVALGQLRKLDEAVARRRDGAHALSLAIADVGEVSPPATTPGADPVYWRYRLRVDTRALGADVEALGEALAALGIASAPGYIGRPVFMCRMLQERRTFGRSRFPFEGECRRGEPALEYRLEDYPGAVSGLARSLVLPWNERYCAAHVERIANAIRSAVGGIAARSKR
jgi:dTDP-4-amino-4,6-dideoxygalactose transaminase